MNNRLNDKVRLPYPPLLVDATVREVRWLPALPHNVMAGTHDGEYLGAEHPQAERPV